MRVYDSKWIISLGTERTSQNGWNLGKTVLCQNIPAKGNAADNYRPISCLILMWKLITGVIAESI